MILVLNVAQTDGADEAGGVVFAEHQTTRFVGIIGLTVFGDRVDQRLCHLDPEDSHVPLTST